MKTKNLKLFIILGIIVILTTFGLSKMSGLVCNLLLITWAIAWVCSSKFVTSGITKRLQNYIIYGIWALQIITIGVLWDEIDSYIPIEYRLPFSCTVLWGIIATAVILTIIYSVNRWKKNESESIISIITMIVSGAVGIIIMLFCSGLLDDLAKESLYLLLAVTAIEWTILAVTLYSRMNILSLKNI